MPLESVIRPRIHPSMHFKSRLRNRLKIRNSRSKRTFIRRVSREALSIREIPRRRFSFFLRYMERKERKVQNGNPNLKLFLFYDWFVLVDLTNGELVTIYRISKRWCGLFLDIVAARARIENLSGDIEITKTRKESGLDGNRKGSAIQGPIQAGQLPDAQSQDR